MQNFLTLLSIQHTRNVISRLALADKKPKEEAKIQTVRIF